MFLARGAGCAFSYAEMKDWRFLDLLVIVDHEVTVAMLILNDIVTGRTVNQGQVLRLCQAAARIGKARDMVHPTKAIPHAA